MRILPNWHCEDHSSLLAIMIATAVVIITTVILIIITIVTISIMLSISLVFSSKPIGSSVNIGININFLNIGIGIDTDFLVDSFGQRRVAQDPI